MKEKIAFVVVRYGLNINGGAEYHCQMLAERLTPDYEVEVLTTCVRDAESGRNEYPEGIEYLNGVLIRRFETDPIHAQNRTIYEKKAKFARKLRRFLYRLRLLELFSYLLPIWTYKQKKEIQSINASQFYSSTLNEFISKHKDDYKVFIAMSLDYPTFFYTVAYAGNKTIGIPTMHNASISFRSLLTSVVSQIRYMGFNSGEELKLAKRIFGKAMRSYGIISVGIEEPIAANWTTVRSRYMLPDEYLLYVGRITQVKLYRLLTYFQAYKEKYKKSTLKLVLVGGITIEKLNHPDIIYTGFVSDEEKMSILQHATIVVNPSNGESLSLILLEALKQGKPMLVNGLCKVLKEHCIKSDYAAFYYTNATSFNKKLHKLESSENLRQQMGEKGKRYVEENYNWPLIMDRLKNVIENINESK